MERERWQECVRTEGGDICVEITEGVCGERR